MVDTLQNQNEITDENSEDNDLTWFYYNNIISPQDCDALCQFFIRNIDNIENATISDSIGDKEIINTNIRNVNRLQMPTNTGIGAILTAIGIDANYKRWNFDITRSNQCDFLRYPVNGRYKGHIDTFLSNVPYHRTECRKLTVLAFLNDNFSGGQFFLKVGSEPVYPPQTKGTVLVFPSFLHHGVEDVTEGERFSAVTWMVGPWFK